MQAFSPELMEQFVSHVQSYAELLFRWKLFHKRLELLKSVNRNITSRDGDDRHAIGNTNYLNGALFLTRET